MARSGAGKLSKIVCCGEGMLELARDGQGWNLAYGGDTLNTAVHLARLGQTVAFLTALGGDEFSNRLKQRWAEEKLDTSYVLEHPSRTVGLYAISTDDRGERSFTYWRDASAAREMFALKGSEAAMEAASNAALLYFSLVTLAILPPDGRRALLNLAERVRQAGGRVAYDNNFRARLWPSAADAVYAHEAAIAVAGIGLPTLEDETHLVQMSDFIDVQRRWRELGCSHVVIKLGAQGCVLPDGQVVPPEKLLSPIDTSGAGDAFNAGYLSAILRGSEPADAARAGHRLAGWVISRSGALPPRDQHAPYD